MSNSPEAQLAILEVTTIAVNQYHHQLYRLKRTMKRKETVRKVTTVFRPSSTHVFRHGVSDFHDEYSSMHQFT